MAAVIIVGCLAFYAFSQDRIFFDHKNLDGNWELILTNADGSVQRPIPKNGLVSHDWSPRISPDGKRFLFSSDRDGIGGHQIFVSDFVTHKVQRLSAPRFVDHAADWSPDGAKIVYGQCDPPMTNCDIVLMNSDGTNPVPFYTSPQDDDLPRFSPDGTQIVFMSNRSGNYDILKCNVNDFGFQRLAFSAFSEGWPSWSPDGSKIIFSSDRDGPTYELYIMNADGTNITRLTNNAVDDISADFSSDGKRIVWSQHFPAGYEIMEAALATPNQARRLTSNGVNDTSPHYHFVTKKANAFRH